MDNSWEGALVLSAVHAYCYGFDDEVPRTTRAQQDTRHHARVLRALQAARSASWRPHAGTPRANHRRPDGSFALPDADALVYTAAGILAAATAPLHREGVYSARPRYTREAVCALVVDGLEAELVAAKDDPVHTGRLRLHASLFDGARNYLSLVRDIEMIADLREVAFADVRNCFASIPRDAVLARLAAGGAEPRAVSVLEALFSTWDAALGLPVHYAASNLLAEYWLAGIDEAAPRPDGIQWMRFTDVVVAVSTAPGTSATRAMHSLLQRCDTRFVFSFPETWDQAHLRELFDRFGVPLRADIPEFARAVVDEATRASPCVSGYIVIEYEAVRDTPAGRAFREHMHRKWSYEFFALSMGRYARPVRNVLVPLCVDWMHAEGPRPERRSAEDAHHYSLAVARVSAAVRRLAGAAATAIDVRTLRYLLDFLPDDAVGAIHRYASEVGDRALAAYAGAALLVR